MWWAERVDDLPFMVADATDLTLCCRVGGMAGLKHIYVDTPGWIGDRPGSASNGLGGALLDEALDVTDLVIIPIPPEPLAFQPTVRTIREVVEPRARSAELVPVLVVVAFGPSRTGAEDEPPARDVIERARHVGLQVGVSIAVAADEAAELDALGLLGPRAQHRPRLIVRTVGIARQREEVVPREDDVDAERAPRQLGRVALREHLDAVAVDDHRVAVDLDLARELAVRGVVARQVRVRLRAAEVVDRDDLDPVLLAALVVGPEHVASDAAEAVDADLEGHDTYSEKSELKEFRRATAMSALPAKR